MYNKATFFILILVLMLSVSCKNKLEFVVTNKDSEAIDSLKVIVTGNTYWINNLESEETKKIAIETTGESDVKLRADNRKLLTIEVYFEPRQSGTITAAITKDSVLTFSKSRY